MRKQFYQFFIAVLAGLMLSVTAQAQSGNGQSAVEAAEQSVNQLLQKVKELRPYFDSEPERYYDGIEEEVSKFVDFNEVARGVMARYSQMATAEQMEAFGNKLRETLTRFYGSALVEYGGQELNYLPSEEAPEDPDAPTTVRMQVNTNGSQIELRYALFKNDAGEWKLRNLYVGGINLRRQYYTQFAALMARHNNDIDQVIEAWQ